MPRKKELTRKIHVLLSPQDYKRLQERYKSSTCRSFSDFHREALCGRAVAIKYRNQSADDFLLIALDLKRNLEEALAEIKRMAGSQQQSVEPAIGVLQGQVTAIRLRMDEIYQSWSS